MRLSTDLKTNKTALTFAALFFLIALLLVACGDGDAGLSRAEVEEIVRAEMAQAPTPPQPEPALTSADVEKAIRAAIAEMLQPESGLSKSDVEEIVQSTLADIPQPQPGLTSAQAEQIDRRRWHLVDLGIHAYLGGELRRMGVRRRLAQRRVGRLS